MANLEPCRISDSSVRDRLAQMEKALYDAHGHLDRLEGCASAVNKADDGQPGVIGLLASCQSLAVNLSVRAQNISEIIGPL